MVGKRQHGDGVLADEGGADGSARHRRAVAPLEQGNVTALWQLNDDVGALTFFAIVPVEPRAQATRLDSDNRIGSRIESSFLAEHLHPDDVFLQLIAAAGDRFRHDKADEALEPIYLLKGGTGENAVERLLNRLLGGFFLRRHYRSHSHGHSYSRQSPAENERERSAKAGKRAQGAVT